MPQFWRVRNWKSMSLLPLSYVFCGISGFRRGWYKSRNRRMKTIPVPVIVVGNIALGGSGKTPAVLWLTRQLRRKGYRPGIISRGYGGSRIDAHEVFSYSDPFEHGDEAVFLARESACPIVTGVDRCAAARTLLSLYPDCDVIVSDDGMQHYALARTIEIAVFDPKTLGNGWLLPAGPLRENTKRLQQVDLIFTHGADKQSVKQFCGDTPVFNMALEGDIFRKLLNAESIWHAKDFTQPVHALAGIGLPRRFFNQLRDMGLSVIEHPFPDHHLFTPKDLDFAPGEIKIMTSKDAVKCQQFATEDCWEFPVQAHMEEHAWEYIEELLNAHG